MPDYNIRVTADFSSVAKSSAQVESGAKNARAALEALGKEVKELAAGNGKGASWLASYGLGETEAKQLGANLGIYHKAASTVSTLAKAVKELESAGGAEATTRLSQSLKTLHDSLAGVSLMSEGQVKALRQQIELYREAAKVSGELAKQEQALAAARKNDAQADAAKQSAATKERVAAERERANLARESQREAAAAAREQAAAQRQVAKAAQDAARAAERKQAAMDKAAAAAARAAAVNWERQVRAVERLSYAGSEMEMIYRRVALAAAAIPSVAVASAASQERAFVDVARTTQRSVESLEWLRETYQSMSTELPKTFEELSQIGTLGAQMDIAPSQLDNFTDAVAKFSSITGYSVDQSALAFGRLSNMIGTLNESAPGVGDQFNILASQIAEMGAKSVSTESEILNVAQAIATTGDTIGLSQDEIVAYSATFASLKIPQHWARGSFQAIVSKISVAVAEGGEKLDEFAAATGRTSDEFARMWRENPNQLLAELWQSVQNLGSADAKIGQLLDLGFKGRREMELILRLANNYQLLEKAMKDAAEAGSNTNFLDRSVELISQTAVESMKRAKNAIANFLADTGDAMLGPIKLASTAIIAFMKLLESVPQSILGVAGAVAAIWAVRAAYVLVQAAVLRFIGSQVRVKQSLAEVGIEGQASITNLIRLYRTLQTQVLATNGAMRSTVSATSALGVASQAAGASGALGMARMAGAAGSAAGGMARLASIGSKLKWALGGWVGIAITAGSFALPILSDWLTGSSNQADKLASSLDQLGGATALFQAIMADTNDSITGEQKNLADLVTVMDANSNSTKENEVTTRYWLDAQGKVVSSTKEAGDAVDGYSLKIGKNTEALIANAVQQSGILEDIDKGTMDYLSQRGFALNEYTRILSTQGKEDAAKYLQGFRDQFDKEVQANKESIKKSYASLQDFKPASPQLQGFSLHDPSGMTAELKKAYDALKAVDSLGGDTFNELNRALSEAAFLGTDMSAAMEEAEGSMDGAGDAAAGAADDIDKIADAFKKVIDMSFAFVDAQAGVMQAMDDLATSVNENGGYIGVGSEGGRENLQALEAYLSSVVDLATATASELGYSAEETTAYIKEVVRQAIADLESQGYDLSNVQGAMDNLYAILESNPPKPTIDASAFYAEANNMVNVANQTASNVNAVLSGVYAALRSVGAPALSAFVRGAGIKPRAFAAPRPNFSSLTNGYRGVPSESRRGRGGGGGGGGGRGGGGGGNRGDDYRPRSNRSKEKTPEEEFKDYISRLSNAMSEALDKFWDMTTATDNYQKSLLTLRKRLDDSIKKVKELRKENSNLATEIRGDQVKLADLDYFQSIANKYGDKQRAEEARVEADSIRASIQEKKEKIATNDKEIESTNRTRLALHGYSEAAIENRASLAGLQRQMLEMIKTYAAQGHSSEQVRAYAQRLKAEFVQQATQMGFNRATVNQYARAFDSLSYSIQHVPRHVQVQVDADTSRARSALNGIAHSAPSIPMSTYASNPWQPTHDVQAWANRAVIAFRAAVSGIRAGIGGFRGYAEGGLVPGRTPSDRRRDNLLVNSPSGPVGLQSGEFVVRSAAVQRYGVGILDAINNMRVPQVAPTVVNNSRPEAKEVRVRLSQDQIAAIGRAVSTSVTIGTQSIGNASARANVNDSNRGVY